MNVDSFMTRDVITVGPDTPIHKAARLMVDHGVSGLPVVDGAGRLVGLISEGDLILRQKSRQPVSWWRAFLDDGEGLAREYQKAAGTTVGEVMSRPVISVSPAQPIATAAAILHDCRIRRLPVVVDGQLVGIVSRGDLVKALAAVPREGVRRSDLELKAAMRTRMAAERWTSPCDLFIDAHDGVITLMGMVNTEAEKSAFETMARTIEGCRSVDNRLVIRAAIVPYAYGV